MDTSRYRAGILNQIYSELLQQSEVKNKKDFAEKVHYDYCCMSSALNGNPKYLSDKLFNKVFKAFKGINPANYPLSPSINIEKNTHDVKETEVSSEKSSISLGQINKMLMLLEQQQQLTANSQLQIDKMLKSIDRLVDQICKITAADSLHETYSAQENGLTKLL